MQYAGKRLRHELKYIISTGEYRCLKARLEAAMSADAHTADGGERVRSLYFDDVFDSAYHEKASGIEMRKKYRIRIYNESAALIKLECKQKFGSLTAKESATLNMDQYRVLLCGGDCSFLLNAGEMAAGMYGAVKTRLLAPSVITDYLREAYTCENGNLRVTFDSDVRAGIYETDIFSPGLITADCLEPGTLILEVKYDDFLPGYIKKMLQIPSHRREAVSKFLYCKNTQLARNPAARGFRFTAGIHQMQIRETIP